jgi:type II secretory pathway pseudopilin PulG
MNTAHSSLAVLVVVVVVVVVFVFVVASWSSWILSAVTIICLSIVSYSLFRTCLQEAGSWAGECNKMADLCSIETAFCWKVCTPQTWSPEMQRNFYVSFPKNVALSMLGSGYGIFGLLGHHP